jgi:hypothetical protein
VFIHGAETAAPFAAIRLGTEMKDVLHRRHLRSKGRHVRDIRIFADDDARAGVIDLMA